MKKILLATILLISGATYAQNVGIGTKTPDPSAILDLNSTSKGLLLPRLKESQRNAIPSPKEGLIVYQNDGNKGIYIYQSGRWNNITSLSSTNTRMMNASIGTLTEGYLTVGDAAGDVISSDLYYNRGRFSLGSIDTSIAMNVFVPKTTTTTVAKFYSLNNGIGINVNSDGSTEFAAVYGGIAPMHFRNGAVRVLTISDNGNVGFGTNSPETKAHFFEGTSNTATLARFATLNNKLDLKVNDDGSTEFVSFAAVAPMHFTQGTIRRMTVSDNGNFGIGIARPQEKLDVDGSIQQTAVKNKYLKASATGKLVASAIADTAYYVGANLATAVKVNSNAAGYLAVGDFTNNGLTSFPSGYRLIVQDGILTEKMNLALKTSNSWADYVFEPNYRLMPLNEVEEFVKENKHLPNVPSADEMVQKGLDVAQTSRMFMEKIEELTLYMIELKKEVEALKAENSRLK